MSSAALFVVAFVLALPPELLSLQTAPQGATPAKPAGQKPKPPPPRAKPAAPQPKPAARTAAPAPLPPVAAAPAPPPPLDLRFKTTYSTGAQRTESVTYMKGARERFEFADMVLIKQHDEKRTVQISSSAKTYLLIP